MLSKVWLVLFLLSFSAPAQTYYWACGLLSSAEGDGFFIVADDSTSQTKLYFDVDWVLKEGTVKAGVYPGTFKKSSTGVSGTVIAALPGLPFGAQFSLSARTDSKWFSTELYVLYPESSQPGAASVFGDTVCKRLKG